MESFAQRLQKATSDKGITQKELAKIAGITPAAVSSYLSGAYVPREKTLARIAAALGVDAGDLAGKSPFAKPPKDGTVRKVQLPVLDINVR